MVNRDEPISKKYSETTGKQPRLNVLIMVNDGVSLSSAARYIPKTLQYLSNEMNGTIFTGFHALGENSLPNIFPVLTGLPHSEASIDAPFIWKHFSEQGYKTFYLEDTITATISYIGDGFAKPPTDYYTHPFWVAMENSSLYWDSQTFCLGDMPIHRIAIQYLANYVEKHRYQSYFALYFLNAISHHSDTVIQLGDEDYRDFLIDQKRIGHFNNTIMLFMSDHGSRFGRIRSTPIGHLEARNPMLIMVLPPWLRKQYPHIAAAVNSNADRLVTPYDIHATLLDILHSRLPTVTESTDGKKHEGGSGKGLSLFRNLPIRRTCASAGIPEDTCTLCTPLEPTFLDVNSQKAHLIASAVLARINDIINATSECNFLHISKIIYIAIISGNRPCFTYSVIIKTVPGRGIFEASVRETTATASVSTESQYSVITPVIRLSLYDSNCCCTDDNSMNKYCHCKMTTKPMRRKDIPNGH
ncbi:uncharacterized protein LOC106159022 [Lingula anatina]|uniref:Uncharacterized protein LOC106159022 n=1 Tax=Lingula anatina TaxID=7574 RepID=A0A1S3HXA1_LINAN|nr:uncharacterized protein LOC106159022 [Lingula anatina]|eukprot:XP_013390638.2 uncharacterized protein LOC106159022 [Lingula anatina]